MHVTAAFNPCLGWLSINPWGWELCTVILRFMAGGSHVKLLSSFSCGHQALSWVFTVPECICFPQDKYTAIGNSWLPLSSSFFPPPPHIWLWVQFSKSTPINLNERLALSGLDIIQQLNWALGCHLLGIDSPKKLTPHSKSPRARCRIAPGRNNGCQAGYFYQNSKWLFFFLAPQMSRLSQC